MKRIKYICVVVLAVVGVSCSSVKVMHVDEVEKVGDYMMYYYLPKTILCIEVDVKKEISKRGPYAEYAKELLGIDNVVISDKVNFSIAGVSMSANSQRDESQQFFISTKGKSYIENINLTDDGVILGVNTTVADRKIMKKEVGKSHVGEDMAFVDLSIKPFKKEKIDTTYKRVFRDSSYVNQPIYSTSLVTKDKKEKAEEAAKFIIKLRKRRFKLIAGMYDKFPEGEALQEMVLALNELEEEYVGLFVGKKVSTIAKYVYNYTPSALEKESNICYWSSDKGLSDTKVAGNVPLVIKIKKDTQSDGLKSVHNKMGVLKSEGKLKSGLAFRNTTYARIEIKQANKIHYNDKFIIAQLGSIGYLPLKQELGFAIEYNRETGSLKSVTNHNK